MPLPKGCLIILLKYLNTNFQILLPFALDLATGRLVLLKTSAYLTDPGCEVFDLLLDQVIRKPPDGIPNVLPKLDIVASLLRDILRHGWGRYSQHL